MTQRQAKKPYNGSQPTITTFFSQYTQRTEPQSSSTSSFLPDNVQSNLISVGMRVRKSVTEGYKTGSDYSAFNLCNENAEIMGSPQSPTKTRPRANAGAGVRELMPFCGVLNVGGLDNQQWGIFQQKKEPGSWSRYESQAGNEGAMYDEDDVPFLSQGSTVSNESAPTTPNGTKRRCEWDDSGDEISVEENDFKTNSCIIPSERMIAVPRRRKNQGTANSSSPLFGVKRESVTQGARIFGQDMDFGEAEFLDFGAALQHGEIEMTDA